MSRTFVFDGDFGRDMQAVRDLLIRLNDPRVTTPGFLWARWDWAFTLPFLDRAHLDRIGVWQEGDRVVAVATYESALGEAWLISAPDHRGLLPEMADHAIAHLRGPAGLRIMVPDSDSELGEALAERGFSATSEGESNLRRGLTALPDVTPPPGFRVRTLDDPWDLHRLHRLIHRGFDHDGEPSLAPEELAWRMRSTNGPAQHPDLQVIVEAPDGQYAAFCGTWVWPGSTYAVVEPVCTDPAFRRLGCGRAAVTEALHRAAKRGASEAWVGSDQEFYVRLGFTPGPGGHWWTAP